MLKQAIRFDIIAAYVRGIGGLISVSQISQTVKFDQPFVESALNALRCSYWAYVARCPIYSVPITILNFNFSSRAGVGHRVRGEGRHDPVDVQCDGAPRSAPQS